MRFNLKQEISFISQMFSGIFNVLFKVVAVVGVDWFIYTQWVSKLISVPLGSMTIKDILMVILGAISLLVAPVIVLAMINYAERQEKKEHDQSSEKN